MPGITYDAGALTATERNDRRLWALHRRALERGIVPTVPAGVVAQGWRGGPQAQMSRLLLPPRQSFGEWFDVDDIPDTLIAVLAEAGRHYLPWVARATVAGSAVVDLADGVTAEIASTPFLDTARGVMLARYVAARSPQLDAILERAGLLTYFADHVDQATSVPDVSAAARPAQNRPYPID